MERRAKIVATLGPASGAEPLLSSLLLAGVDVVRLNLSHGAPAEHRRTLAAVRKADRVLGRPIPVLMDLMGPRFRLAPFGEPRRLEQGETVVLGPEPGARVPIERDLVRHLRPGERLLIDNGLLELRVESADGARASATVLAGGVITDRKGINLPDTEIPFTLTPKDRSDIAFAVAEGADFLGVSYVGAPEGLHAVRAEIAATGGRPIPLVAKLERAAALARLEAIVEAADAIMVARGDLGVEVPLHEVPVLQKRMVRAGLRTGRPVIVATQMLESMVTQPRPTRAEATDVANAVFDGADALMLSTETAAGEHPVEAVTVMARIIEEAERYGSHGGPAAPSPVGHAAEGEAEIPDLISGAAVHVAAHPGINRIVAFSQGGFTPRLIARHRPQIPIVVFTTDERVSRQVQLVWGARPLMIEAEVQNHDEVVRVVERELLGRGLAAAGEVVVILMGEPMRERPLTNLMRLHRIGGRPAGG